MKQFLVRNNLNLLALLGVGVIAYLAIFWAEMPVMQRTVGVFFVALVAHVWEEMRYPGGFAELMTSRLDFAIHNIDAAHAIVGGYVLYLVFVPLFFRTSPGWRWRRWCWACWKRSPTSGPSSSFDFHVRTRQEWRRPSLCCCRSR